jgi:squalene-hopene/tetraprenyl-beta-curcumene cyclase
MLTSTRNSVLDAALEVLIQDGSNSLTLERVAREAGISKGGLLYHYAGKEQLVEALIDLVVRAVPSGTELGSRTREFIKATLQPEGDETSIQGHEIAAVLLAAMATNPKLLDPLRTRYRDWQAAPARATVARLAAEGLWFSEALGLAPPPRERRAAIVREILSLTESPSTRKDEEMAERSDSLPAQPVSEGVIPLASPGMEIQELAQQAEQAARISASGLTRLQKAEGFWRGDLRADTTLESDYVLLSLWLYPPDENGWNPPVRAKIVKALRTILDRQLPDGGWNIYPGGPAEINATVRAYVALKLGGHDPEHTAMQRARERVLALGGLQAANSYTKINFSLLGLFPRQFAPTVPPELVLMPGNLLYEMSSWSRTIIVPLSIVQATGVQRRPPAGMPIDELYLPETKLSLPKRDRLSRVFNQADRFLKLWERRGLKEIRAKAIREAEKWMLDHMRFSDGLGGIYPSMMYALMAMDALGYERDQPDFVETLKQFEALTIETEDRLEFEPAVSPVWDTAIALFALGELGAGEPDSMRRAADWLLDREVRRKGDWAVKRPDLQPGGWAFEFANDFYPDIDDTAMVLLALEYAKASDPERQARAEHRAVQWLLGMQSSDGGWAAFDVDNNWQVLSKVPFADHNAMLDPTCPDITGRVLEALCRRGYPREHPAIERAVEYLLTHQKSDGSWYGRWGVNYTYGTFLALRGLRASGSASSGPAVQRAAEWLRSVQNADGGWGESCASYDTHGFAGAASTPSQTAWALLGLDAAADRNSDAVCRGVSWLLQYQNAVGGWDEDLMTGTGFPNVFYLSYTLYRHYFPLLALATFTKSVYFPNA